MSPETVQNKLSPNERQIGFQGKTNPLGASENLVGYLGSENEIQYPNNGNFNPFGRLSCHSHFNGYSKAYEVETSLYPPIPDASQCNKK